MNHKGRIGLGTVQFGMPYGVSNLSGQTPVGEVSRILEYAKSQKIDLLDTASAYGSAERVLGSQDLKAFQVVTKFLPPPDGIELRYQLFNSLENLGIPDLYGYLAHRPLSLLKNPHHWQDLLAFRRKGYVEKIGYSLNTPLELEQLLAADFVPDIIQIPVNYVDRRFERLAKELKERGCEIHARSVFLQGLFFKKTEELADYFNEMKPVIDSVQKSSRHLAGALIQYVLDQNYIDRVIIGVEDKAQLTENLKSLDKAEKLPEQKVTVPEKILIPSMWPKITT